MATYYRIQPTGLGITGHYSETSVTWETGELADGIHVFTAPCQTFATDGDMDSYGNEVVVIQADQEWDNGDVEGVCIDPEDAQIIARFSWESWIELWKSIVTDAGDEFDIESMDLSDYDEEIEGAIIG